MTRAFQSVVMRRLDVSDARFDRIDAKLEEHDRRFDRIDAKLEEHDRCFERIDRCFERIDRRFERIDRRFDTNEAELRRIGVLLEDQSAKLDLVLEAVVDRGRLQDKMTSLPAIVEDHEQRLRLLETLPSPRT